MTWLHYQKVMVRKEVKWKMIDGLDRDELSLIAISKDQKGQLEWEHSKEFEYQGEMYDVVYKKETGDSLFYWCWWDHKETQLNRQLASLTRILLDSDTKRKESSSRITFFFKSLYSDANKDRERVALEDPLEFHEIYSKSWKSLTLSPPSPPPRQG
jgi:hypothetical protein